MISLAKDLKASSSVGMTKSGPSQEGPVSSEGGTVSISTARAGSSLSLILGERLDPEKDILVDDAGKGDLVALAVGDGLRGVVLLFRQGLNCSSSSKTIISRASTAISLRGLDEAD